MKRLMTAICGAMLAGASCAAIVTARNNFFVSPSTAATFVGTRASPAIASQWIPYGTYTDGTGGTEYLRLSTNLAGVVYSMFDGLAERSCAAVPGYGDLAWDYDGDSTTYDFVVPPALWGASSDDGGFLQSPTNQSLRIMDVLNSDSLGRYHYGYWSHKWEKEPQTTVRAYDGLASGLGTLEERLAVNLSSPYAFDGKYQKAGLASFFGGVYLDSALGVDTLRPPISTSWTTNLPFRASDANRWVKIWPTYAALDCDFRFWPYVNFDELTREHDNVFVRSHLKSFMDYGSWDWYGSPEQGDAYETEKDALYEALLLTPLAPNIESILSRDTGFSFRDGEYTQWEIDGAVFPGSGNPSGGDYARGIDPDDARWEGEDRILSWDKYAGGWFLYNVNWEMIGHAQGSWGATHLEFEMYDTEGTIIANGVFRSDFDDYAHWKNGTTRLDWKRLGIICQLERHMEHTYYANYDLAGLRRDQVDCTRELTYSLTNDYTVAVVREGDEISGHWELRPWATFALTSDTFAAQTNEVYLQSRPYCRVGTADVGISWSGSGERPLVIPVSEWDAYLSSTNCGIQVADASSGLNTGFYVESSDGHRWTFAFGPSVWAESLLRLNNCFFTRVDSKSGSYTHTVPQMYVDYLYPAELAWKKGFVGSVWMPTLECLLSVKNDTTFFEDDEGLSYGKMLDLQSQTNSMERLFRMDTNSFARCQSTNEWKTAMQNILFGLNDAVHAKCADLSGMAMSQADMADTWLPSAAEIAQVPVSYACNFEVASALQAGYHPVKPTPQYTLADGTVTNSLPIVVDEGGVQGYVVGYVHAGGYNSASVSSTNCVPAVAEGKMKHIFKTLWRFNNLCDPNL